MPFQLTDAQSRALRAEASLCVTANAGAGKTSVLARRFIEVLLRPGVSLGDIVAITFSESAAGELQQKIRKLLGEAVGERPESAAGILAALQQLSSATIGTIHAYCARILRLYPVEAGIDAAFRIVEGSERARLIRDAIAGTVEEYAPDDSPFGRFAAETGPKKISALLEALFRRREQAEGFSGAYLDPARSDADIAAAWIAEISGYLDRELARSRWRETVRAVRQAAPPGKFEAPPDEAAGAGAAGAGAAGAGAASFPGAEAAAFAAVCDQLFNAKGELKKAPGLESVAGIGELRTLWTSLKPLVEALPSGADVPAADLRLAGAVRGILTLFAQAESAYAAKKTEAGLLDFEDLQLKARDLLHSPEIRRSVAARFYLVDEFQDTNDLQYEILSLLLDGFQAGNVFFVGDPKQSIYGFRDAEVRLFAEAMAVLKGLGDPGVVMAESFRALPELAAFVNAVFGPRMAKGGEEIPYSDLVVGREPDGRGAVEIMLTDESAGGTAAECAMVAGRIALLLAAPAPDSGRPIGPGDVAILLRDRTRLTELERALEEAKVPFQVAGGIGFYETQEISDFLNYLSFLSEERDDVALAGILRSPFFLLSDTELHRLALGGPGRPGQSGPQARWSPDGSLWKNLVRDAAGAGEWAGRALRILTAHRALADRLPVHRLLRRIARDTGWLGTVSLSAAGLQRRENFLKLVSIARDAPRSGAVSLHDFCNAVRRLGDDREGHAHTAGVKDAVSIHTIHSAKGMEFRAVFIPFADRGIRLEKAPFIEPRKGIAFAPGAEPDADEREPAQPAYLEYLKLIQKRRRTEEEVRVYYVGCTRAKDLLVVSGDSGASGECLLGWIGEAAARAGADLSSPVADLGSIQLKFSAPGRKAVTRSVPLRIPVSRGPAAIGAGAGPPSAPAPGARPASAGGGSQRETAAATPAGEEAVPQSRILVAPIEDRAAGEIYSATQIRTFFECPGLYRLRYSLGLEGETGGSFGGGILPGDGKSDPAGDWQDLDGDRAADATLAGEITHALLKQVGAQPPSDAQVGTILGGFGESSGPVADAARSGLEAFLGSSYGRSVMAAPEFHNEFQLAMMFDGALLTGIIDRVWKRDGWELVDYKTDRVAAEDLAARAARYEPQMGVYAMLASAFFAQPSIRATLLFLRHPGQPQVIEFSAGKLQTFREKLSDALRRIRSGDFSALPDRPGGGPPAGDRCASCPFRDSGPECPLRPGGTSHP